MLQNTGWYVFQSSLSYHQGAYSCTKQLVRIVIIAVILDNFEDFSYHIKEKQL